MTSKTEIDLFISSFVSYSLHLCHFVLPPWPSPLTTSASVLSSSAPRPASFLSGTPISLPLLLLFLPAVADAFARRVFSLIVICYGGKLLVRYFGSFLTIAAAQSNIPARLTFGANNVRSHSKRAISSAIIVGMSGTSDIFALLV